MRKYKLVSDDVNVDGIYRIGSDSGIVLYIDCKHAEKPTATVGCNLDVPIVWENELGMCPAFNTYISANCTLHTKKPTDMSIIRLVPIIDE